jgi:hypothetical protein
MARSAGRHTLLQKLGLRVPIIQAPMAGVSTPEMAAAVSSAGGLGSIGVGATDAAGARAMIRAVRERCSGPLHVNVFCHAAPIANAARETAWLERLRPEFARFAQPPPAALHALAKATGEFGYGAHWAGQGAPLCRTGASAAILQALAAELESCRGETRVVG